MPFNGSGTYIPPSLPGSFNPAISGQQATPADWNALLTDLASALSSVITKDGQTIVTGDIPLANFRLKLVGDAAVGTDAPNAAQIQKDMGYAADTGAADAYVIAPVPAITAYAVGQPFTFKVVHANLTTTPTLAVSGLTAGIIGWPYGALVASDLPANAVVTVRVATVTAGTPTFQLESPTVAPLAPTNPTLLVPTAAVIPFAGSSAPSGWLLCDGSSQLRATYAALFTAIGTTYGSADGTHFTLPDLRGRGPFGRDDMGGSAANRITNGGSGITGTALGSSGGEQNHTLITSEMPAHVHSQAGGPISLGGSGGGSTINGSPGNADTGSTGGDGAHQNMPPALILNYIIKT